jgi:hypothetical protein
MFEQAFNNIDDVLWKEAGCTTEFDYTEQTSWLLRDETQRLAGLYDRKLATLEALKKSRFHQGFTGEL